MVSAVGGSIINVASRKLKEVNFAVIQFNYALTSATVMAVVVLVVYLNTGRTPFVYDSWLVYLEILVASVVNMLAQNVATISNQNANPGTVALIAYIGVVYNFLCDYFVFELDLSGMQAIGVAICLVCSVGAAIHRISAKQVKQKEVDQSADYERAFTTTDETDDRSSPRHQK